MNLLSRFFGALFIVAAASVFGPSSFAASSIPFHAEFHTRFEVVAVEAALLHVEVSGSGIATHLGLTTASSNDQVVDSSNGEVTATYYLTSANGDQLALAFHVHATPVEGGLEIAGSWEVIGGTGRFENRTGSGTLAGSATFTSATTGVDHFFLNGQLLK